MKFMTPMTLRPSTLEDGESVVECLLCRAARYLSYSGSDLCDCGRPIK
jgi:hypothetical protein